MNNRQSLAGTKVTVVLTRSDQQNTPMTAHLKQLGGRLAKVEDVAH